MKKNKNFTVVDLFCGCGGFSKGFKDAGFNILLGIDNWKDATFTYSKYFKNTQILTKDITTIEGSMLLDYMGGQKKDIDVIIGGPPCQGFSVSGKRPVDDPRNVLYKSFVNIVKYIKPKLFVMENVPGLIGLFNGKVKDEVVNDFTDIGYSVNYQLLLACDYGVPQTRKRVFFVGLNRSGRAPVSGGKES